MLGQKNEDFSFASTMSKRKMSEAVKGEATDAGDRGDGEKAEGNEGSVTEEMKGASTSMI
jgi:hypothetical protein